MQTFWWKGLKHCCFQMGTMNEFVYLDVQWYCYSKEWRNCLLPVDPVSSFRFGNGTCKHLLALSKVWSKSSILSIKELSSLLGIFTLSWRKEGCCVCISQNRNILSAKDFSLEPLVTRAIRCWDREVSELLWKYVYFKLIC